MGTILKLKLLNDREVEYLTKISEIQNQRKELIKKMELESINKKLTRKQVAELLEYNYFYLPKLNIPFQNNRIFYLRLLKWIKKNKPSRIKRLEQNFKAFLN